MMGLPSHPQRRAAVFREAARLYEETLQPAGCVELTSRAIRRTALLHALLSSMDNTVILAFTLNPVAGMAG
jgi:hypothetical protein